MQRNFDNLRRHLHTASPMNYAIRRTTTAAAAAGADSDVVSLDAAWRGCMHVEYWLLASATSADH